MERVYNSVQQIIMECDNLLKFSKDSVYYDVNALAKTVKDDRDNLEKYFNDNPGDTVNLNIKKRELEDIALRLEFFIVNRLGECEERYNRRKLAANLYNHCKDKFFIASRDDNEDRNIKMMWGRLYRWAQGYYVRSFHILFEDNEEDIKNIDIINKMRREC